ncbi:mCG1042530, partial [Mus musculus]
SSRSVLGASPGMSARISEDRAKSSAQANARRPTRVLPLSRLQWAAFATASVYFGLRTAFINKSLETEIKFAQENNNILRNLY